MDRSPERVMSAVLARIPARCARALADAVDHEASAVKTTASMSARKLSHAWRPLQPLALHAPAEHGRGLSSYISLRTRNVPAPTMLNCRAANITKISMAGPPCQPATPRMLRGDGEPRVRSLREHPGAHRGVRHSSLGEDVRSGFEQKGGFSVSGFRKRQSVAGLQRPKDPM